MTSLRRARGLADTACDEFGIDQQHLARLQDTITIEPVALEKVGNTDAVARRDLPRAVAAYDGVVA